MITSYYLYIVQQAGSRAVVSDCVTETTMKWTSLLLLVISLLSTTFLVTAVTSHQL